MDQPQKLYNEIADWWPLLSAPEEYEEEAGFYAGFLQKYRPDAKTLLELGSGGGNNALYLKKKWNMTLCDLSEKMVDVSRALNPECEHHVGDMRTVQLGKKFDLIFIHDAVMFMKTEDDLKQLFENCSAHLNDKGFLLITPDYFRETFQPGTESGGHDGNGKALRYLEWSRDENPDDDVIEVDYLYIMDDHGEKTVMHDFSNFGIFSKRVWQKLLEQAGFKVHYEPIPHTDVPPGTYTAIAAELL